MNKKLRSLTWKYFWEQKAKELIMIPCALILSYVLARFGRFMDLLMKTEDSLLICEELSGACWLTYLFAGSCLAAMICFVLVGILFGLHCFIMSNWKKAEKRAKEKLRNIKKGSRKT